MNRDNLTLVALVGLAALMVIALSVVAVLQILQGKPVALPTELTNLATLAITALFGQALFFGHKSAVTDVTNTMLDALASQPPVIPTTPSASSGSTTTPSARPSTATTPTPISNPQTTP